MAPVRLLILGACLLAVAPASLAANLVVNGDFEGYGGGYTVASQGLAGWTVVGANPDDQVFVFGPTPGFGPQTDALDLSGFSDNAGQGVEQTVATLAGSSYRLSFDYWTGANSLPSSLDVFVNGIAIADELSSGADALPRTFVHTFTANGPTTLRFLSGDLVVANDIDNVSLTAIPEPGTGAMLLAGLLGLGMTRRICAGLAFRSAAPRTARPGR